MIELLLGLLLGAATGIVIGFIPGFSLGFVFLLAGNLNPLFSLGFIVAADAVGSVTKQLNILLPSAVAEQVHITSELPQLLKKGHGLSAVLTASFAYTFTKIGLLIGAMLLVVTGTAQYLTLPLSWQVLAVPLALILWTKLVIKCENKLIAVVVLLMAGALGYISTKLSGSNIMLALSTSLFGIGAAAELTQTALPKQNKPEIHPELPLECILAGAMSSIFFGLPASAILATMVEESKDPFKKLAQNSIADAAGSVFGLLIVLTSGGSRSAAATMIGNTLDQSNICLSLGLLGITLFFTLLAYVNMRSISEYYASIVQNVSSKTISFCLIGLAVAVVLTSTHWMGIFLIFAGICLQQIIKSAELPQEISLIAVSAIPLFSFLGL